MKILKIKHKKILIIAILSFFGFSSCNKLLDVKPKNLVLEEEAFNNQESFNRVLNGAYSNLMGIDGGELLGGDFNLIPTLLLRLSGREVTWNGELSYKNLLTKKYINTNVKIESNWQRAYKTINLANAIIEKVDKSDITEKERIKGEALAIRGILYFELVRLWAPQYSSSTSSSPAIPLVLNSIQTKDDIKTPVKSTVSQIYAQAEKDLKQASSLLKSRGKNGDKISHYACEAYLARMQMQKNDYKKAIAHLNTVINGGYSLVAEPTDAFNNEKNSREDILAVQQTPKSNTGTVATGTGLSTIHSIFDGYGLFSFGILNFTLKITFDDKDKILDSARYRPNSPNFSAIDKRYSIDSIDSKSDFPKEFKSAFYLDPKTKFQLSCAKYVSNTKVVPVIRLSEMYLNRAEALHLENYSSPINATALSDLNKIRTRAGLVAIDNTISADEFYDSIILERNRELLYEGLLFHDVKRRAANGKVVLIGKQYSPLDPKLILPIPQSECDASPGLCK